MPNLSVSNIYHVKFSICELDLLASAITFDVNIHANARHTMSTCASCMKIFHGSHLQAHTSNCLLGQQRAIHPSYLMLL